MIFLLVGGIVHLWVDEWRKLDIRDGESSDKRPCVWRCMTCMYVWWNSPCSARPYWNGEVADVENTRTSGRRWTAYLPLQNIYPAERIDSVRRLLEDKEKQLCGIMRVLDEQEDINERIAERVPVIAWKSTQEEPKRSARGLFGIFGKRKSRNRPPQPPCSTRSTVT